MLLFLAVALAASLLAGAISLLTITIFKMTVAVRDFRRRSGGMKLFDNLSIWAGHVNSVLVADGLIYLLDDAFRRLNTKSICFFYGAQKVVASIDLDLFKQIVIDNQESDRVTLNFPIKEVEFDCILTAKGEQWQRIRRAIAPALKSSKFNTPNVQREINNSIGKLIGAIDSKFELANKPEIELNLDDYAHRYTLDLVFSCFYKQDNLIDFHAQVDPMTRLVDAGLRDAKNPVVGLAVIFPVLRPIIDWITLNFHRSGAWRKKILHFIKQQTKLNFEARKHLERLRKSGQFVEDEDSFALQDGTKFRRNMIDHVIDQFYEGKITKSEYFHSAWFLVSAADKTSSDAITYTIYQLATHLDVQDKLRKSIGAEGENSEYLSWVIYESLRLLPPAPNGCARGTSREYRCADGIVLEGTYVIPPTYSIHRLERYWGRDANQFKPERFADASHFHPLQYMPFGYGARGCPGKEFVLHEMKRLLCALLARYRFRCEPIELRFNSPWLMFMIPDKVVRVKLSRL